MSKYMAKCVPSYRIVSKTSGFGAEMKTAYLILKRTFTFSRLYVQWLRGWSIETDCLDTNQSWVTSYYITLFRLPKLCSSVIHLQNGDIP